MGGDSDCVGDGDVANCVVGSPKGAWREAYSESGVFKGDP